MHKQGQKQSCKLRCFVQGNSATHKTLMFLLRANGII